MYEWCRDPESNRNALRRGILSPVRLPVPPSRQRKLSIMLYLNKLSKMHRTRLLNYAEIFCRLPVTREENMLQLIVVRLALDRRADKVGSVHRDLQDVGLARSDSMAVGYA